MPNYGGTPGNDTFIGDPTITEEDYFIFGGWGDDFLKGGLHTNNYIQGEAGNDVLIGGLEYNVLIGGNRNDQLSVQQYSLASKLYGGDGNDTLIAGSITDGVVKRAPVGMFMDGGAGADKLIGGKGRDTAGYHDAPARVVVYLGHTDRNTGNAKNDTFSSIENLSGSPYDDRLYGDSDANDILGQNGNDTIVGGGGADRLYGGSGADRFVYVGISQSNMGARDIISDFSHGDQIVVHAIDANSTIEGNQDFHFIGTDSFSNSAGELRYKNSGTHAYIYGDVNGDGIADFAVILSHSITLSKADFVL